MKNEKKLLTWMVVGNFVIFSLASIWHFIFAWFKVIPLALIAPVNESPWEHIKLFFVPAIIFYVIEYFFIGKKYKNYLVARSVALIIMPVIMFSLYYGYKDFLHIPEKLSYDILITIISIIGGNVLAYYLTKSKKDYKKYTIVTPITIIVLFIAYSLLTFFPPQKPIFFDRNFNGYGIDNESLDNNNDD